MKIFRRYKLVAPAALMLAAILFAQSAWCLDSTGLAGIANNVGVSKSADGGLSEFFNLPDHFEYTTNRWFRRFEDISYIYFDVYCPGDYYRPTDYWGTVDGVPGRLYFWDTNYPFGSTYHFSYVCILTTSGYLSPMVSVSDSDLGGRPYPFGYVRTRLGLTP